MPALHRSAAPLAAFAAFVLALTLAACTGPAVRGPAHPHASDGPAGAIVRNDPVLLVSVDGLHPDRINPTDSPNIARLAANGVQARWMTPSYPTLTFPNHYTLVTGLRPDRHGIVHNSMHDPALGGFKLSDREAVGTSAWWGGEPLWVSAEKAGMPTATMFWPGSEAEIAGVRPTRWFLYDESLGAAARADTVADWLLEPDRTRPRLATLYFHSIDTAAHGHGPDSAQARDALADIDAAIGRLLDRLERGGRLAQTNIVLVSDHGMAPVPPGQQVPTTDFASHEEARFISIGQVVTLEPKPGFEAVLDARLPGRHAHHACWRRGSLPARWHYGTHPRVPSIVCQMDEGWDAVPPHVLAKRTTGAVRGSHGYDPGLPSMRAVFVAHGPAFRRGVVIDPIDNVNVYPMLARLLGIEPAEHDGDPAALLPALATPEP